MAHHRQLSLDVTDPAAADAAVRVAVDRFGGLDIIVNNAGYGNVNSVEDTTLDDFRRQIETNLFGTIIMTKAVIPIMREHAPATSFKSLRSAAASAPRVELPTRRRNGASKASPRFLPGRWR